MMDGGKADIVAAALDELAMVDEEGSRTLVIRSNGLLAGSRGWLRRGRAVAHCSGAAVVAFGLPDYDSDDVPHDESRRWCSPRTICSGRPPRGTGTTSSKFHAINRQPVTASGGSSGSGSGATAAKGLSCLASWPSCPQSRGAQGTQDCQQPRLSSRCRPGGRELDRREEDEQRSRSPTPPSAPSSAWSQLSVLSQSMFCGEACVFPPLVTAALAGIPPTLPTGLAERHDFRQRITGAICFAVHYRSSKLACEDVPTVRVNDGRTFVEDLDRSGLAYKAGVRPGDEIVRIKVASLTTAGQVASLSDRTSSGGADFFSRLRHDAMLAGQPAVVFFMGFAGKFPAEVRVSGEEFETSKRVSVWDLTNDGAFQLHDVVDFKQGAPLLIACRPIGEDVAREFSEEGSCGGEKRRVAKTLGDVDQAPAAEEHSAGDSKTGSPGKAEDLTFPGSETPSSASGTDCTSEAAATQTPAPWQLMEVERREAKRLVAEALYSLPRDDAEASLCRVMHVKDFGPKSVVA